MILRFTFLGALVLGFALPVIFRHAWFTENFGVIDPGRAYRAAQPYENLAELIRSNHLASVLNLRGGSVADPWYLNEIRSTEALGVDLYDLPMSASHRPKRRELLGLIEILNHCEYPLLIHCKSGADRTGLATVLYLMLQKNEPPRAALRGFTTYYGHFPVGPSQTLHEPIDEYADWLEEERLDHSPDRFENWVKTMYQSDDPYRTRPPIAPGPRMGRDMISRTTSPDEPRR